MRQCTKTSLAALCLIDGNINIVLSLSLLNQRIFGVLYITYRKQDVLNCYFRSHHLNTEIFLRFMSRQTQGPSLVLRVQNITSSWDETVLEVAPPRGQELEGIVCRVTGILHDLAGSVHCPFGLE